MNRDTLLNSKLAFNIMKTLIKNKDKGKIKGKYVEEIADSIGSPANSVTNYLRMLREQDLVKKGKRTYRQYYIITEKGKLMFLYMILRREILKKLDEDIYLLIKGKNSIVEQILNDEVFK